MAMQQLFSRAIRTAAGWKALTSTVGRRLPTGTASLRWFAAAGPSDHILRPLYDERTWTWTFLLGDPESKEAIIIDPVFEQAERDANLCKELGLNLIFGINTHMHADHITGTGKLKKLIPTCQSLISKNTLAKADRYLDDGDKIKFGKFELECRATPGHTLGCITYVWHDKAMAFTGDALLVRKCGRTDFPNGDPAALYKAIHEKIFSLPDHFLLYPGHDYAGHLVTTVGEEKKFNTRLLKPPAEFVAIMEGLNLPLPKYIKESITLNLQDGDVEAASLGLIRHILNL